MDITEIMTVTYYIAIYSELEIDQMDIIMFFASAFCYVIQYAIFNHKEERTHLSLRVADIVIQIINQANSVCEPFDFWFGVQ